MPDITQANGGVRQYACALLKILALDSGNHYYVLHNEEDPIILEIVANYANLTLIPQSIGREGRIEKAIRYARLLSSQVLDKIKLVKATEVLGHVERICNRYAIDIVYSPYQYTPVTTRKTIVTLHDIQEIHFPQFFTPAERLERAVVHKHVAEKSTLIVVSYEHVKQDLITYFQRTRENVLVCLLAMENLWFDKLSDKPIADLTSFHLPSTFIFYPAVSWPHKNHMALLKAIAHLRDEGQLTINAVFTGHQSDYYAQIEQTVRQLSLEKQVYFLGVVTEEVLYALYHTAQAVVVPTLYEAGSFPLMESMMMGIPVVCSNVTSLPDAIGDQQFVFNATDVDDMADKIKRICLDEEYRRSNIENGTKQAARLRQTDALEKLTATIAELGVN